MKFVDRGPAYSNGPRRVRYAVATGGDASWGSKAVAAARPARSNRRRFSPVKGGWRAAKRKQILKTKSPKS